MNRLTEENAAFRRNVRVFMGIVADSDANVRINDKTGRENRQKVRTWQNRPKTVDKSGGVCYNNKVVSENSACAGSQRQQTILENDTERSTERQSDFEELNASGAGLSFKEAALASGGEK